MKGVRYGAISFAITAIVIYQFSSHSTPLRVEPLSDSIVKWKTDFQAALDLAKSSHRVILADFYGDACSGCIQQDAETFRDPTLLTAMETVVPVKLRLQDPEAAKLFDKYAVSVMPTTIIMSDDGKELTRSVGFTSAKDMIQLLKVKN